MFCNGAGTTNSFKNISKGAINAYKTQPKGASYHKNKICEKNFVFINIL